MRLGVCFTLAKVICLFCRSNCGRRCRVSIYGEPRDVYYFQATGMVLYVMATGVLALRLDRWISASFFMFYICWLASTSTAGVSADCACLPACPCALALRRRPDWQEAGRKGGPSVGGVGDGAGGGRLFLGAHPVREHLRRGALARSLLPGRLPAQAGTALPQDFVNAGRGSHRLPAGS